MWQWCIGEKGQLKLMQLHLKLVYWLCTGQGLAKWKLETQFGKNSSSMLPLMIPGWVFSCSAKNSDHDTDAICQLQLHKPQINSRLNHKKFFITLEKITLKERRKWKVKAKRVPGWSVYSDGRFWGRCALPIQTWPSLVTSTLPSLLPLRQGELTHEYWEYTVQNIWSQPKNLIHQRIVYSPLLTLPPGSAQLLWLEWYKIFSCCPRLTLLFAPIHPM